MSVDYELGRKLLAEYDAIGHETQERELGLWMIRNAEALLNPISPAIDRETAAAQDVLAERERQKTVEGWTPKHDDEHDCGSMARAAACYALSSVGYKGDHPVQLNVWPWADEWWKPKDARRDLVRAGALILAEIERLDLRLLWH